MNQILVTGEEKVTGNVTRQVNKQKKVLPINGIVIFYAISIIILGICMISGSAFANAKINETIQANIKPEITLERNDENNTIELRVTHIRKIEKIIYSWNDEEENLIEGRERKEINHVIDLIYGENTLKIAVTEENGQVRTFEKTFIAGSIPEIELEAVSNGIKVVVSGDEILKYIRYNWDDEEVQQIEIGEKQYEGIINAPKGQHTLKIEVEDIKGVKANKEQVVVGDTEPTVKVESKIINGKATFVIDAEDDENLKTITIVHNGGTQQIIDVNAKICHYEVTMTEGVENTIIVTATNENNLTKTRAIKFTNK